MATLESKLRKRLGGSKKTRGLPTRSPRKSLAKNSLGDREKKGLIRRSIEGLERLEGGDLREGSRAFPRNSFVVVSKGPHRGKSGTVVGSRVGRLGTRAELFIRVGLGRSPGTRTEILVSPRHLVRAPG